MRTLSRRPLPRLLCLAALGFNAVALTAYAAGPEAVPELSGTSRINRSGPVDDDSDFWASFWQSPGGVTWKQIQFEPQLNYRAFYTDNIFTLSSGAAASDFLHYVSPSLQVGRIWERETSATDLRVSYQPTFVLYTDHSEFDRVDHAAHFGLDHSWGEQSILLDHSYRKTSEATTQTVYLVSQEINTTKIAYERPLTGKIHLDAEVTQDFRDSDRTSLSSAQKLRKWQASSFATMDLFPKTSVGLGLSGGYADQQAALRDYAAVNERLLTRWSYIISGKLTATLDAGVQFMQSLTSGFEDPSIRPVIDATINYQPRYGTAFGLSGFRSAGAAEFAFGEVFTGSGIRFSARQRIYEKMAVIGSFRYLVGEYEDLRVKGVSRNQDFDQYSAGLEFQWHPNPRLTVSVFYQYLDYKSDLQIESLSNNQVGLNATVKF